MNEQQEAVPHTPSHKIHGAVILCITALFYVVFFSQFDSSDGGGQPTLPGMGKIVAFILVILAVIVTIYQLLVFRTIRRSRRMSIANIMLAIPLIVMVTLSLGLLELPDRYTMSICCCLIASLFIQFFGLRRTSFVWAGIGYAIMGVSLVLALDWAGRSERNPRWWQNGRIITYYENGRKKSEIEKVVEGDGSGAFIYWNEDGTLYAYDRFAEGNLKPADSSVRYHPNGAVYSISYTFDSGGIGYKRRIGYTENGLLRSFDQETTTLERQFQRSESYDPRSGALRHLDYNFDSAGERYRRTLTYDEQGLRWIRLEGLHKPSRYVKRLPRHK